MQPNPLDERQLPTWNHQRDPAQGSLPRQASRGALFSHGTKNDRFFLMSSRTSSVRSSPTALVLSDQDSIDSIASDTTSEGLPCLTRGNSVASSTSEAQTDDASALHGGYVLESHDGVLTLPNRFQPNADLLCPFQILDCNITFSDIVEFKMHVFSHFRGHPLPGFASCFLCDNKYFQTPEDDPAWAWNNMLAHMTYEHFRQGQQLATIRTDFTLMRWMYNRRIISDHQYKRTQLCPLPTLLPSANGGVPQILNMPQAPSPPSAPGSLELEIPVAQSVGFQSEPFVVMAGRRADRNRRDATRSFVRPRTRANF